MAAFDTLAGYNFSKYEAVQIEFKKNDKDYIIHPKDIVYYDKHAGHDIGYNDELYRVIRMRDIVLVE